MASHYIEKKIKEELKKDRSLKKLKWQEGLMIKLFLQDHSLTRGYKTFTSSTNISEVYEQMKQKTIESFATCTSGGSGWIFQSIENLFLKVDRFNPLKGAGYSDSPAAIKTKKAVINVKNKDNRYFEYAILSALHHNEIKEKHERPSKYKAHLGKLYFTGIEFPVSLKDIDKFEKQNPEFKVNVFGYERSVHILRLNKTDPQNAIDFLSITNKENQHYCWIKNF